MIVTEAAARENRANLAGSLWMVAAMAIFSVEDATVKAASAHLPIAEVLVLFGLGGAVLFAIAAIARVNRCSAPASCRAPCAYVHASK